MTDEQIIKGLEICSNNAINMALDLINRQKVEIERLNDERLYYKVLYHELLIKKMTEEEE